MSASAKKPAFPLHCANTGCAKALAGPVAFCPYCGASSQLAATPAPVVAVAAPVVTSVAASVATPTPAPVAVVVPEAKPRARDVVAVQPAVPLSPAPTATLIPTAKPRKLAGKLGLAAAVLVAIGGYGAYQMNARQALQQFEADLEAGNTCLRANQFNCALDKAGLALRSDSKDPRALSLLQRAQAGLDRQLRDEQAKTQAAALAAATKAAQAAAAEQALRDQQAREQAAREQQARDQAAREQLARASAAREPDPLAKAQRLLDEQQKRAQQQLQKQHAVPVNRPSNQAANAGLVGQQLSQARSALAQGNGNKARVLANMVLSQDPGNRQAQIILRQAEQLGAKSSFQTPKGLGGVMIE